MLEQPGALVFVILRTGKSLEWSMAPAASPGRVGRREPSARQPRSGRPTLSDRLPRAWLFPLLVYAATWVLILASWSISNRIYHQNVLWSQYFMYKDAGWFLSVAQLGFPAKLPVGKWTHVAATVDGKTGQQRLYVNGQVVTED